jgi:hypothetical protein
LRGLGDEAATVRGWVERWVCGKCGEVQSGHCAVTFKTERVRG